MVRYWKHRGKEIFKHVEPHIEKYFPYHKPEVDRVSPSRAMLTGKKIRAPFDLALGQVVPFEQKLFASSQNVIKVRIHKLCLNRFLLKYYYQTGTFWTHTQGIETDIGDIVLVKKSEENPAAFHTVYNLKKVVFPIGNIRDPVTGAACEGPHYAVDTLKSILSSSINDKKE